MLQHSSPRVDWLTKLAEGFGVAFILVNDGMQCSGGFFLHSGAVEKGL